MTVRAVPIYVVECDGPRCDVGFRQLSGDDVQAARYASMLGWLASVDGEDYGGDYCPTCRTAIEGEVEQ